jgi:ligand-binding SRPBCC domain-containing protein
MTSDPRAPAHPLPRERRADGPGTFTRTHHGWTYEREHLLRRQRADVDAFFSDPRNLVRIMPASMQFRLVTSDAARLHDGQELDYRFTFCGLPLAWTARISQIDPGRSFVDELVRGPFSSWRHEHSLHDDPAGTIVRDRVDFRSPLWTLGRIADELFVKRTIERVFDHRSASLGIHLGEAAEGGAQ